MEEQGRIAGQQSLEKLGEGLADGPVEARAIRRIRYPAINPQKSAQALLAWGHRNTLLWAQRDRPSPPRRIP